MCAGTFVCARLYVMHRKQRTDKPWMSSSESNHGSVFTASTATENDNDSDCGVPGLGWSAAMFVDVITRAIITHSPAGDSQATPLVSCYARLALLTPLVM